MFIWLLGCVGEGGLPAEAGEGAGGLEAVGPASPGDPGGDGGIPGGGDGSVGGPIPDPSDEVFDPDVVAEIALTLDEDDWRELRDDPEAEDWYAATFVWNGETVAPVGVRSFGYTSHVVGKPPLKIAFDHYRAGLRWRELEQLKLDAGYKDLTFLNERLCTAIMRRAGIPAARTGWARVTVNGDPAGFYVVLEPIDDRFLVRNFGNADGPLWAPDDTRGTGLLPHEDPTRVYAAQTSVKTDGDELVELARLVGEGNDDELAAAVDLRDFFVEAVIRTLQGSQDNLAADGNNFYLYQDPAVDPDGDGQGFWRLISWDFDRDLITYGLTTGLSLDASAPWTTSAWAYDPATREPYHDPLHERQIAGGADVEALVEELWAGPMEWNALDAEAAEAAALIRDEARGDPIDDGRFDQRVADLRLYLHMRATQDLGREVAECAGWERDAVGIGDLDPTGTVGRGALAVDGWGLEKDGGLSCGPLAGPCVGFQVGGEHVCRGVFAFAPSRVDVDVPSGFERLRGSVGIQNVGEDCGDGVVFRVEQGGAVLWESDTVRPYEAAVPFDVAIGAGALALVADAGASTSCDAAAWLDVRVVP